MATRIPENHRKKMGRASGVKHEAAWQEKNMRDRQMLESEEHDKKLAQKQQLRQPTVGTTKVSGSPQPPGKKGK